MKRRRGHIFLILFVAGCVLTVLACAKDEPEGTLTRAEMVEILEDLYVTEEKVNNLALSRDSAKIVFEAMGRKVFENATVTDSVFKRSFDYYMERPKDMELIYTGLVDSLQLKEQRAPFSAEHQ